MKIICPHCQLHLHAGNEFISAGQSASCPACNGIIDFTGPPPDLQHNLRPPPVQLATERNVTRQMMVHQSNPIQLRGWLDVRAVFVGMLVLMFVGIGSVLVLRAHNVSEAKSEPTGADAVLTTSSSAVSGTQRILEEHNRKLQDEVERLRAQNDKIQNESQTLQGQLKELELETQQLQEKVVIVNRWRQAAFVLSTPRTAVGIHPIENGQFRIVATAQYPQTEYITRVSEKLAIPRVVQNDRLAQQICETVQPDQTAPQQLADQLGKYWRVHKYVAPGKNEQPTFVMFKDLAMNQSRVGFLLGVNNEALTFQPVGSNQEVIPRGRIQSGTARKGSAERLLAEPEADYLDVSILRLAQHLESEENVPGLLSVAVEVHTDALQEAIELSKEKDHTANDRCLDYLARIRNEPFRPDARKEPTRELRRFAAYLQDEIGARLARLRIPIVERQELQSILSERALSRSDSFEPSNHAKLHCASHLVVAEVDKPRQDGSFRVAIRLIEADTGTRLFEDNGELERKAVTTAERFSLNSGQLAVLGAHASRGSKSPRNQMAPLFARNWPDKGRPSERIVVLETDVNNVARYRELFSHELHAMPGESCNIQPLPNVASNMVPTCQQLRLITWQVANAVLPAAGRIAVVNGDRVTLSIGSGQEVKKGDRFKVVRIDKRSDSPDDAHRYSTSVLPFSLRADVASGSHTIAYIDQSGLDQLWSDTGVRSGDLVLRDGAKDAIVYLDRLIPDRILLSKGAAIQYNLLKPAQVSRLNDTMSHFAEGLQNALSAALEKLGITCVASPESATHVVCGGIAPIKGNSNDTTFCVQLHVRKPTSQQNVATILPIELNTEQVANWRP